METQDIKVAIISQLAFRTAIVGTILKLQLANKDLGDQFLDDLSFFIGVASQTVPQYMESTDPDSTPELQLAVVRRIYEMHQEILSEIVKRRGELVPGD